MYSSRMRTARPLTGSCPPTPPGVEQTDARENITFASFATQAAININMNAL